VTVVITATLARTTTSAFYAGQTGVFTNLDPRAQLNPVAGVY